MKGDYTGWLAGVTAQRIGDHPQMKGDYTIAMTGCSVPRLEITPNEGGLHLMFSLVTMLVCWRSPPYEGAIPARVGTCERTAMRWH